MAAPVWKSYAARSFGIAGAGNFIGWVVAGSPDPADAILEVKALVKTTATSDPSDPDAVVVPVALRVNGQGFSQNLPGEPCVVSWFCRVASGWLAGPQVPCNFVAEWEVVFPFLKPWAVSTLQRLNRERPAMDVDLPRKLTIRTAYPRDNIALPSISVQFEALPQGQPVLGDYAASLGVNLAEQRVPWSISLSVVCWCETPEDRDALTPWFLQAMTALGSLSPMVGLAEPSYQFSEGEDFSASLYEKPLFLVSCTLSGTLWSDLKLPAHNYIGHLTI